MPSALAGAVKNIKNAVVNDNTENSNLFFVNKAYNDYYYLSTMLSFKPPARESCLRIYFD